jgi:kinetochore protein Mis13/DSN1
VVSILIRVRLRNEKAALEAVLRPPEITAIEYQPFNTPTENFDKTLLSEDDAALLENLHSSVNLSRDISSRLEAITSTLEPIVDSFADGIHKIAQYRNAADSVANRVLSICADRISEREREGRKKALHIEDDRSPGRDLSSVLRGLSKVDR